MANSFFSTAEAAEQLNVSLEDARDLAARIEVERLGGDNGAFVWTDDDIDEADALLDELEEEDASTATAEAEEAAEEAQAAADEAAARADGVVDVDEDDEDDDDLDDEEDDDED